MQVTKNSVILDTPKSKRQLRHSNYFITINTNKRFTGHEEDYNTFVNAFKQSLDKQFDNLENLIQIKEEGHNFSDMYIKKIAIESVIEKAPKTNAIHAHILIKIAHYTLVSLDFNCLKEAIKNDLKLSNVYLQVRLYRNANDNLERYLYKNSEKLSQ